MERLSHPNWRKVIAVSQLHRKFNRCVPASKRCETRKSLAASFQGNSPGKPAEYGNKGKNKVERNKRTPWHKLFTSSSSSSSSSSLPSHNPFFLHHYFQDLYSSLSQHICDLCYLGKTWLKLIYELYGRRTWKRIVGALWRNLIVSLTISQNLTSPPLSCNKKQRKKIKTRANDNSVRSRNSSFLYFFSILSSRLSAAAKGPSHEPTRARREEWAAYHAIPQSYSAG